MHISKRRVSLFFLDVKLWPNKFRLRAMKAIQSYQNLENEKQHRSNHPLFRERWRNSISMSLSTIISSSIFVPFLKKRNVKSTPLGDDPANPKWLNDKKRWRKLANIFYNWQLLGFFSKAGIRKEYFPSISLRQNHLTSSKEFIKWSVIYL